MNTLQNIGLGAAILTTGICFAQNELHYAATMAKNATTLMAMPIQIPGSSTGVVWELEAGELIRPLLAGNGLSTNVQIVSIDYAGTKAAKAPLTLSSEQMQLALAKLKDLIDAPLPGQPLFPSSPGTGSIISAARQSEVLYAVADVLVDRLKEELALSYFDRASSAMGKAFLLHRECTKNSQARVGICSTAEIMPNTKLLFANSRNHISPQIGSTLKAALMTDLEELPKNFASSYDAGLRRLAHETCAATVGELDQIALFGARIYNGITDRRSWLEIIEDLTRHDGLKPEWKKRCQGVDLGLQLVLSIVDPKSGRPTAVDISTLSEPMLNAYVSLLLENSKVKDALSGLGLGTTYATIRPKITSVARELLNAAKAAERLSAASPSFSGDAQDRGNKVAAAAEALKDLVIHTDSAALLLHNALTGNTTGLSIPKKVFEYYDGATALASAVAGGNYGRASLAALKFLDGALDEGASLDNDLVKLLTLAADIADAENGKVKEIFEAAILPVGSFRIKQSTTFSVSVNAYAGGSFGVEMLSDGGATKSYGGIFAPVGVALSRSRGSEKHLRASHSLLLSVFDLGAVLSYRFASEDSVASAPEITFANVMAPGLHYVYGIKNSPLSLGAGFEYAPQLRSIVGNQAQISSTGAFRIGLFVAVDIPFFHLSLRRGNYNWATKKYDEKMKLVRSENDATKKLKLQEEANEYLNW